MQDKEEAERVLLGAVEIDVRGRQAVTSLGALKSGTLALVARTTGTIRWGRCPSSEHATRCSNWHAKSRKNQAPNNRGRPFCPPSRGRRRMIRPMGTRLGCVEAVEEAARVVWEAGRLDDGA